MEPGRKGEAIDGCRCPKEDISGDSEGIIVISVVFGKEGR